MKFSNGGIKTLRNVTESSKNAALLTRAGYIDQVAAGVYTYLNLGNRVLAKIENIIRKEMVAVGGVEILMPVLHPAENWKKTGRWESVDDLFRFKSYYSKLDYALGPTHEEIVTPLAKRYISSYKDLPLYLFQIQTKFRDEKRAKSGLLRNREFPMKDLYSFHATKKDLDDYYEKVKAAYFRIFKQCGLGNDTFLTFASGGSFSKYSHEFQTISEAGEDTIYFCEKCEIAVNKEIIEQQKVCPSCGGKDLQEKRGIEVGNIFKLGKRFSEAFKLTYRDESDHENPVEMGCYGIGPGRVMGTIVEVLGDEKGLVWPESVAPFRAHLVSLDGNEQQAEKIYKNLSDGGIEVLFDDRKESAGVKLSDADLIGIPYRIVVSDKTLESGKIEVAERKTKKVKMVSDKELISILK